MKCQPQRGAERRLLQQQEEAVTGRRLLLQLLCLVAVAWPAAQAQCTKSDVTLTGGLRTVTCNRVQLDSVPDAPAVPAGTESLALPNNRIAALSHASLARLAGSLQELDLTNNYLDAIPPDLFANMTKLRKVDLSKNRLRTMPQGFITTAPYVEELILARNQFPVLPSRFLQGMPRLRRLVLADCAIEEIQPDAFVALAAPALAELDLSNNALEQLDARVEADIFKPTLTAIRLYENFWRCDCKLRWLRSAVDARKVKWTFDGDTYVPKCEEPKKLKHKSWQLVMEAEFGCKPSIVEQSRTKRTRFLPGMRMTLSCAFDSDPPAIVRWSHDGASLDTAHRYSFSTAQNGTVMTAQLSVPSATARDEGMYVCTAASSFGTDNASITVSVSPEGNVEAVEDLGGISTTTIIAIAVAGATTIIALATAAYCARQRIVQRGTYLNAKDEDMPMLLQSPTSAGGAQHATMLATVDDYEPPPREHEASLLGEACASPPQLASAKGGFSSSSSSSVAAPPDIIKHYPEEQEPLMHREPVARLAAPAAVDPVTEYPHDDAGYREYNAYLAMIAEPQAMAAAGSGGEDDDERLADVEPEFATGLGGAAGAVGDPSSSYQLRATAPASGGAALALPPHQRTLGQPAMAAASAAAQQPAGMTLTHGSTLNTIPEEN